MKRIKDKNISGEKPLQGLASLHLEGISFGGREPGEYPLKDSKKVELTHCSFEMPFAVWNCRDIKMDHITFSEKARSPIWHCHDIIVTDSRFLGVKAVRECENTVFQDAFFQSEELAWKCGHIDFKHCIIQTQYLLFCARDVRMENTNATGEYALQYVEGGELHECVIISQDALLHCKDITIYDSDINGDRLGWYSTNLKLIRCRIFGNQPLCYAHNVTIEDCVMEGCEGAFEYSEIVKATIAGSIKSIKNPDKGTIEVDRAEAIIQDRDRRDVLGEVKIIERGKIADNAKPN
jgi:hypothetical protein